MQGKIKGGYQPLRQAAGVYGLAANGGDVPRLPPIASDCEHFGYGYQVVSFGRNP